MDILPVFNLADLSKQRVNRISGYRDRADLRGRPNLPEITEIHKIRLQSIYNQEVNSVKSSLQEFVKPLLPLLIVREDNSISVFDKFKSAFKKAIKKHFGSLLKGSDPDTTEYSLRIFKKVKPVIDGAQKDHARQYESYYNSIAGVDPITPQPGLKDLLQIASSENSQKITTISQDYFSEIEQAVFQGLRSGTSNATIVDEIEKIIQTTAKTKKTNSKLIAADQIQKLNGDLDRIRQRTNGGSRYIWRTRNNGRVRHDHEKLDGAIFEWGDPPITVSTGKRAGERNEPGQDINCKCRSEMVIEDVLNIKSEKIKKAEAKTAKLKTQGII